MKHGYHPSFEDSIKIKPCPFCGSIGELQEDMYGFYVMQCVNCGCQTPKKRAGWGSEKASMDLAIEAWNRRVSDER